MLKIGNNYKPYTLYQCNNNSFLPWIEFLKHTNKSGIDLNHLNDTQSNIPTVSDASEYGMGDCDTIEMTGYMN